MTATIDVRSVSKWYGNVVAVNDVSLQVEPGITGLLGPNGAGKTTLLHMIAGLAGPSEGEVLMLGEPVRDNPPLYRRMGFMSEHESIYEMLTGRGFVELAADLHGMDPTGAARRPGAGARRALRSTRPAHRHLLQRHAATRPYGRRPGERP